jgi:hypothetical protein
VLLVSLLAPLSALSTAATATLLAMHLVVGGILLGWLPGGERPAHRPT